MEIDNTIIDWEISMKLAGNNPDLAKELLLLLAKSLPTDLQEIRQAYQTKQYLPLAKSVHKLHGAVSYCGVPQLQKNLQGLEIALKRSKIEELPTLMMDLEVSVASVTQHIMQMVGKK